MSLKHFDIQSWSTPISADMQAEAVQYLENGHLLSFPALNFDLLESESDFLSADISNPTAKNISYDLRKDRLAGATCSEDIALQLKTMLKRYALATRQLLERLIPHYTPVLIPGKTSFRPVEIRGRKTKSFRQDDSLLHVDAFPSNPTKGQRILRFFTNVNPDHQPRVWRLGEPFEDVAEKMLPRASAPLWGLAKLYQWLGITKDYRTPYDHYMNQIHDTMKGDQNYQKTVPQSEVLLPAGSSWMVYTDQVSHAAMAGRCVLEQTFHLPADGMKDCSTAPLKVLERHLNKALV